MHRIIFAVYFPSFVKFVINNVLFPGLTNIEPAVYFEAICRSFDHNYGLPLLLILACRMTSRLIIVD